MIYFTGDTHFSHANIMKYCNRPFRSVEEMDATLIANINDRVGKNDILYHLGDWSFCRDKWGIVAAAESFRKQIRCKEVVLIWGNHDPKPNTQIRSNFARLFDGCHDILDFSLPERFNRDGYARNMVLCHYSMMVWNKSHHGAWHGYGHSHGTLPERSNALSMDLGVDAVAARMAAACAKADPLNQNPRNFLNPKEYAPISVDEVAKILNARDFVGIDHHA